MKRKSFSYSLTFSALLLGLIGVLGLSLCMGRYPIGLREIPQILWGRLTGVQGAYSPVQEALLLEHRLPRVLLAAMVGCCLSSAGASYQGVFRNPMAAPDLLGASGGAAFGAALALLLGLSRGQVIALAFLCSLASVALVLLIGKHCRGKRVLGLILGGIMVSSLLSSATSLIKLVADPEDQLPAITYWLMGSFNAVGRKELLVALFPMIIGTVPLLLLRWRINLLTLGDEEAHSLGIRPDRLRFAVILCATLITAASVAVSGVIGWVGLVVPHLMRKLVGDNYQKLLPCSMIFGGSFLLLIDDISRNLLATEIPIGILTGFVGAPFFLYMITKDGERH